MVQLLSRLVSWKYRGMPTTMLNGKVIASAAVIEIAGFASGMAIRMAAGAAMYDALPAKVASRTVPPGLRPITVPSRMPSPAAKIGMPTLKPIRKMPVLRRSPKWLAATRPISSRKRQSTPLNNWRKNGVSGSIPFGPAAQPTSRPPTSRTTLLPSSTS